jgi:hypothetical protein
VRTSDEVARQLEGPAFVDQRAGEIRGPVALLEPIGDDVHALLQARVLSADDGFRFVARQLDFLHEEFRQRSGFGPGGQLQQHRVGELVEDELLRADESFQAHGNDCSMGRAAGQRAGMVPVRTCDGAVRCARPGGARWNPAGADDCSRASRGESKSTARRRARAPRP